jgi:hypothetical protein
MGGLFIDTDSNPSSYPDVLHGLRKLYLRTIGIQTYVPNSRSYGNLHTLEIDVDTDISRMECLRNELAHLFSHDPMNKRFWHTTNDVNPESYERDVSGKTLLIKLLSALHYLTRERIDHVFFKSAKRDDYESKDIWMNIHFSKAVAFAIKTNNVPRLPYQKIYVCRLNPIAPGMQKSEIHPINYKNGKHYNQDHEGYYSCAYSLEVEDVWVVQCGRTGLLSEIGATISLIRRRGNIEIQVMEKYEMTANGYVRLLFV